MNFQEHTYVCYYRNRLIGKAFDSFKRFFIRQKREQSLHLRKIFSMKGKPLKPLQGISMCQKTFHLRLKKTLAIYHLSCFPEKNQLKNIQKITFCLTRYQASSRSKKKKQGEKITKEQCHLKNCGKHIILFLNFL